MKSKFKPKPLLIVIILILVLFVGSLLTFKYLTSPVDRKDNEEVKVVVEKGTSSSKIGDILKEKRIIKSKTLFKVYLKTQPDIGSVYFFTDNWWKFMFNAKFLNKIKKISSAY